MLRWAMLGTSFISHTMARAIAGSPGSTAVAVAGRDRRRLDEFAARHGIPQTFTSVEEAVAAADVDAVYVGGPNHLHHEHVVLAAGAGRAVLSEKSLTVTMAQADELLAAVAGRVFFVEGLMYLAHPVIARFVDVLGDGRLGTLRAVHTSYSADIWRVVNPAGGGAVFNLGCYPMSLAQLVVDTLLGDGSFVEHSLDATGTVSSRDGNVGEATALLTFGGGVSATVHTAETYGMAWRFEVLGTNGRLYFDTNPWLPAGANRFVWQPYGGLHEEFVVDDPLDAFDHQIRMVERHVAAGALEAARPSPRLADSYALMEALTAWESAARHGV